jgi:hypothetical protein
LTSIKKFYDGDFALTNTIPEIKDKKYNELSEMHRNRLDEYALQLIIVKQESQTIITMQYTKFLKELIVFPPHL